MKTLISIIIPTKNETKNLPRLVESINSQTYKNIETIVVDTGSTDNTMNLASSLGARVYQKGPERSAARNFGASKAKGKYFLFLDADMQLTSKVVEECLNMIEQKEYKALVIPEKTIGNGFFTKIRRFEREMYMGDSSIEVARFFDRRVFEEFEGYDTNLTGPEDYDLPYRISQKYLIGRATSYINHHEANVSLGRLLKKKYYYANKGAIYAKKHPELVWKQGVLFVRRSYLRNWRKFVTKPAWGIAFIFVRLLETFAAVLGFIRAVGIVEFVKTLLGMFKL